MRYNEIKQIDEVRMGKSDLARFLSSPQAKPIRAGFESELIFPTVEQ